MVVISTANSHHFAHALNGKDTRRPARCNGWSTHVGVCVANVQAFVVLTFFSSCIRLFYRTVEGTGICSHDITKHHHTVISSSPLTDGQTSTLYYYYYCLILLTSINIVSQVKKRKLQRQSQKHTQKQVTMSMTMMLISHLHPETVEQINTEWLKKNILKQKYIMQKMTAGRDEFRVSWVLLFGNDLMQI